MMKQLKAFHIAEAAIADKKQGKTSDVNSTALRQRQTPWPIQFQRPTRPPPPPMPSSWPEARGRGRSGCVRAPVSAPLACGAAPPVPPCPAPTLATKSPAAAPAARPCAPAAHSSPKGADRQACIRQIEPRHLRRRDTARAPLLSFATPTPRARARSAGALSTQARRSRAAVQAGMHATVREIG
eukprot:6180136-Pleurochrysis_carterae.AAC.1